MNLTARAQLDRGRLLDAPAHGQLHERARHRIGVEAEITLGEWVEARSIDPYVQSDPEPDGAGAFQTLLESGEQLAERPLAACQQGVNMPTLRNTVAVERIRGQGIALEHQHAFEVIG